MNVNMGSIIPDSFVFLCYPSEFSKLSLIDQARGMGAMVSNDQGGWGWRLEIRKGQGSRGAAGEVERKMGGSWWLAGPDEARRHLTFPHRVPRFTLEEGVIDLLAFTIILSLLFLCPLPVWFPTYPHSQSPTSLAMVQCFCYPPHPSCRPAGEWNQWMPPTPSLTADLCDPSYFRKSLAPPGWWHSAQDRSKQIILYSWGSFFFIIHCVYINIIEWWNHFEVNCLRENKNVCVRDG